MSQRISDFGNLASERWILQERLEKEVDFGTTIKEVTDRSVIYQAAEMQEKLGLFRKPSSRKAVIADMELLSAFQRKRLELPSFLEAGPRERLRFDPHTVRAAMVTTGGVAPGLHCVIHSIVKRHCDTYSIGSTRGRMFGIYNSFEGMCSLANNLVRLDTAMTEEWLDDGGSKLGSKRFYLKNQYGEDMKGPEAIPLLADKITENLENNRIDILYIIGGDGTLRTAHEIAVRNPHRSVIGIPKTMDNDVLWVWQSFGFQTAVEQATRVINTLRSEAEATRRICLIKLFGADSGFVAANAALASGHVDAVLIPEVFRTLSIEQAQAYLDAVIDHIGERVEDEDERAHNPHAVIVVAEGVGQILQDMGAFLGAEKITSDDFIKQLKGRIEAQVKDAHGEKMTVFDNEPRHHIRAVAANSHDQIYCERLGALAVDNALAGYTDCMISQWLTEFVLVPLDLVSRGKKSIPVNGMFWKQVVSSTGQPLSIAERAPVGMMTSSIGKTSTTPRRRAKKKAAPVSVRASKDRNNVKVKAQRKTAVTKSLRKKRPR